MKNEEFCKPRLALTTIADHPLRGGQKSLWPVNVCRGGNAATITTRYGSMDTTNVLSLAHFPMTAILIEHEQ